MPVQCVIFDMDDVLCDYAVQARIAHLAAFSGRRPDEVLASVFDPGFLDSADRGDLTAEDYLDAFGRRLGKTLARAEWVAARRAAMRPFPQMLALVARIAARVPVAVLTNNDSLVAETMPDLFPEIIPLFGDRIFVSATLGHAKPAPACFRACCARIGFEPSAAFFTDDREENVAGARQAGLLAHHFRDHDGLVAALAAAGVVT